MVFSIQHRLWVWALSSVVVALVLMHILSTSLDNSLNSRVSAQLVEWFSLEGEGNFPALFSSLLLLGAAVQFLVIGKMSPESKIKQWNRHWLALAGVFVFLSMDEALMIHEKFDSNTLLSFVQTEGLLAWPWVILYGGLCLAFVSVFLRFWLNLDFDLRWRYCAAAVLYVGAAIGFEMLGAAEYTRHSHATTSYFLLATVEEILEMSAIVFLVSINFSAMQKMCPRFEIALKEAVPPLQDSAS